MYIKPTTKLAELISATQHNKVVRVLEIAADIANAAPPALMAVAVGYEDIQLLFDATRRITEIHGLNTGVVQLKRAIYNVSDKLTGDAPNRIYVMSGLLESATRLNQIITIAFESWPPQLRKESLVIVGVGQRYVDLLRESIKPALAREEKLQEDKALAGYKDLPEDIIPKGNG